MATITSPVVYVDKISDLKNISSPQGQGLTFVQGYATVGDGGGGFFRWVSGDTTPENGGTVFAPTTLPSPAKSNGRWRRVYDGWVNCRWFGCLPGSADNTQAFQNAIDYLGSLGATGTGTEGGTLFVPYGTYRFKFTDGASGLKTISIPYNNVNIVGEGRGSQLTVRSAGCQVPYFFTWSLPVGRGEGGGIRDIGIAGNSQTQWAIFLDSWRFFEVSNVNVMDVFGGMLDACNNKTTFGEAISIRHCDLKSSSGTNPCLSQYFIRFRAGSVGAWSECSIRDCLALGVWDTAYLIDGCMRFTISQIASGNNIGSSNTIDGLSRTGLLTCLKITNSVVNGSTIDSGYHNVEGIYHESHSGVENYANNCAVLIDTPVGQTGLNRYNMVENIAVKSGNGGVVCAFKVSNTGSTTTSYTAMNSLRGLRANLSNLGIIQIGNQASDTSLDLFPSSSLVVNIIDQGNRTVVNGLRNRK
jgi:hypothetical protein